MNTQSEQGGVTKPRLEMAAKQTIPSSFLSAFMMRGECGISMNRRCVACALVRGRPSPMGTSSSSSRHQIEFSNLKRWKSYY